jgi:hypothetical protein
MWTQFISEPGLMMLMLRGSSFDDDDDVLILVTVILTCLNISDSEENLRELIPCRDVNTHPLYHPG